MSSQTGPRGGPPEWTFKPSEVRQRCGVSVDTLQRLIQDRALPSAARAKNGHVYLRADAVPTYQECVELIEQRLHAEVQRASKLMKVEVEVELEAARNNINEAIDDPHAPLGYDLLTFRTRGG